MAGLLPEVVTPPHSPVARCRDPPYHHPSWDDCVSARDILEEPSTGCIVWYDSPAKRHLVAELEMPPSGPENNTCATAPVGVFNPLEVLGVADTMMRRTSCFGPEPLLTVFMQSASLEPPTGRTTRSRASFEPGSEDPALLGSRRASFRNEPAPTSSVTPPPPV